jgi:hypothetical protein
MSWIALAERFDHLPLILAGPLLRNVEPRSVTVWVALKEARTVTLRVYSRTEHNELIQHIDGTQHTVRLGEHLHIVAVTAHTSCDDEALAWGGTYCYDLFFQTDLIGNDTPAQSAHLSTPGILVADPAHATPLERLVYEGQPLPGFMLPQEDLNQLRIVHGSCRKPHADGEDMLAMLDYLLEDTMQDGMDRPQQLFLTGDQIYADDVAAPMLYMLTDAGDFLFGDTYNELLPLVNSPARTLLPGNRREAIYDKALLTTSTPQNHLLSLAEYAAMYLFCWSEVLWPTDLPIVDEIWQDDQQTKAKSKDRLKVEVQCPDNLENMRRFQARLPRVRRALANIATYTICDDHEITDDWFLDGAWCRQVLSSPLGRHIVRNGLLAFALFQGWGNTPGQFADERGQTFLAALDAWRGNEFDSYAGIIDTTLGMPHPFTGKGELQRSPQAFHWHYTYQGPRYQVIALDTRTERRYISQDYFPGLLSPAAMRTQITEAAHKDVDVTFMISATPVLGIDFVESIQFWSRWRVRDNYAYDREAWALEWGTFQHFLQTVSPLLRVVFLTGDVHYAFASSMEYWDNHTKAASKFINYTSSAFHNEGSGSHIAVLAVGYPRLQRLLRRQETPTMDFFAWDIHDDNHHIIDYMLSIIRRRMYRFWWAIPRLIAAHRSPYEVIFPARGWLKGTFDVFPPDRGYRLRYLHNTMTPEITRRTQNLLGSLKRPFLRLTRLALGTLTFIEGQVIRARNSLLRQGSKAEQDAQRLARPATSIRREAVHGTVRIESGIEKRKNILIEIILRYSTWMNRLKASDLIIGYNNIGEISLNWTDDKKDISQHLWWYYPDDNPNHAILRNTTYTDSLQLPTPEMEPPLP